VEFILSLITAQRRLFKRASKRLSLFYHFNNFYVCYFFMDIYNKPSKRKPARSLVPSTREKEAMQRELDRKLPKSNWIPVQTETLEHFTTFMPPVGDSGTAAPPYKEPSNVASDTVVYPNEEYNYGDHYGATRPPASTALRSTTTRLTQGRSIAINNTTTLRRRLGTWARTQRLIVTPTHKAKAFARPTSSRRERAKRRKRSNAWSASWRGWSATLLPLLNSFKRLLVRVS
jgi:hypothetical protein